MSANQRKNNNQRRSNYNNNNNQQQQQQNNKNQHQQQKRPRYQPKQYNNNNNNNNNSNNTNNNQPKQQYNYSPKQQPKRYNQRTGPSSPNNRSQNQNRHHYDQSHPSHQNNSNQQRFKLKPTNTNNTNNNNNNQNRGYNTQNRNYNNNNNSNNNQSPYNRSRRNNQNNNNPNHPYNNQSNQNNNNNDMDLNNANNANNKQMPPGFRQNNDNPDYPPNRYRPNDTNNSERNRNWRNRYTPVDTSANNAYNNLNNARSHNSHHSRSPQSGPSHQHHSHPLNANNNNNGDLNMNMFENTSNRNNLSGSDHSASHSMTPHGPQRESNKAMDAAATTPVAGGGGVGPGGGSSDIGGGGSDSAAGELFGAIYAQNGVEPSIAYPVIKLCLNNDVDGDDNNALASDSKIQRKYPVDWLLGVGKEIRDPPNHPKDDIPDSVKFINTIKIAGNRWKQHHNQAQNANMNTSPGIHAHAHTNSPIPTNNRFGNIHQLTPRQLPLNNNHSPLNPNNNNNPNDDRSWRKLNPLQLNQTINKKATGPNEHDSTINNENDNDHLGATPIPNDDANHVPMSTVIAPDPDRINTANPTDEAPPPHPTEANNATDDPVLEPPKQTIIENEAESAPIPAPMPINNNMISAEAIEEELLRRQQAQTAQAVITQEIIADAVAVTVPVSVDPDNVSGAALPQPGQAHPPPAATLASSADVAVMAAAAVAIAAVDEEEDLDQYKPVNITPELKPDPREMVEEELGIAPEWAREDDPSNNEEITKTDFQFAAVIDKEKDREYIKQSGGVLPETTTTITHEEYQRRKEENKGPKKPPIPHQSSQLSHPLPAPDGIGSLRSQMFGVGRVGSLRSQSTPDGLATYGRDTATNEPLPIDKLPSRIRGIVVRLDEDIAKISTYIQQVALEKDQLNRYQRHLHKLIARRGQYANWWKAQQKKQQVLGSAAGDIAKPNVSVGLRHTNSLQQLEHYKDYYNKQLDKMIISAQTDAKFNTYVDYYRQKLKAVEKRQRELESRQKVIVEAPLEAQALDKEKGASAMDVMNDEAIKNAIKRQSDNAVKAQMPLTSNNNAADNNEDPFASLMNLSDLGYTQATTQHNKPQATPVHKVTQQQPVCNNEEAMHAYIYGAPRHQQSPPQPQVQPQPQPQVPVQPQAQPQPQAAVPHKRDISHQKQKLKAYIRQHALKYVKPPPDPKDETYPHWYQGLRKVENIIYAKYMNKQRKRMEAQQKEYEQMKKHNEHGMDGRSPPSHPQHAAYRAPPHNAHQAASSHPQHVSQHHGHGGHAQHPHSPYGPGPGPHSMHRGMPHGNGPPAQHPHSPYGPPSGAHSHGSPYGSLPPHGPPMPNGSPPVGTQHGAYGPQHHLHPSQQSPPNMMPQHAQQYGAPPGPPPGPPNPHQYNKSPYGHPSTHPVSHSGHGSPQQVSHHTQGSPVSHGTHSQAPHHRMAHLNISPTAQGHNPPRSPPPQQQPQLQGYPPVPQKDVHTHTTHTLPPQAQSHGHPSAQHPQSMNSPPMAMSYYANMSPPLSPQNQQQHSNKYHHALDNRYHRGYAPHAAQQQSPPNPGNNGNAQNAQNPTTTSHGYTTYNTQSPPSNQAMYQQQHQYQASQRSPPNPHQYPMHYQDIADQ